MVWTFNDSDYSLNLPESFLHYKLFIDKTTNQIALSIYKLDGEIILDKKILEKSSSGSYIAKFFYVSIGKGARGPVKLNNISVRSYESCQIYLFYPKRNTIRN